MSCPTHGTACAYTGVEPDLCPVCHVSFEKVERVASFVKSHGVSKETGEPWQVVGYTGGYGQTREGHLAGHATATARKVVAAARRAES